MKSLTSFQDFILQVSKEDFKHYYLTHSKKATQAHFNLGGHVFARVVKYFDVVKSKEDVNKTRELTNLRKYGYANQFQNREKIENAYINKYGSLEAKHQLGAQKAAATVKERYGGYQELYELTEPQRTQTNLRKYGVPHTFSASQVKEKARITKLEKYGDPCYHNIDKMRTTNMERYGVPYNFQSKDTTINGKGTYVARLREDPVFRERVISKRMDTCRSRYGEDYYIQQAHLMSERLSSKAQSSVNQSFSAYLLQCGVPFTSEVVLGNYLYDFQLGNQLIEIDPAATHNTTWGIFGKPKQPEYHRKKTLTALERGYRCFHIFDWMDVADAVYNIVNKNWDLLDTGKERPHIYDIKQKCLVDCESENTVIIYDDGFDIVRVGYENTEN